MCAFSILVPKYTIYIFVSGPFHIIIHCAGIQVIIMKMVKYFKSKSIRENETVQQMVGW